ncbi:PilZ domain-containing protein [Thiohalobacter sp. IOR34]|uniref:PilZ domain-containing protein n=1 Tax=Thiohalobacter sp. IOR34 TaxID=3057176 RepID=UPI0025B026A0|nr:PilZ domain-containing protein [Thiohalobacter sp. IOR34]WJW76096.1 PilZ domain-containing protein [Thiohalobacter sp. IOR34]
MRSYIRHPSEIPIEFRPEQGRTLQREVLNNVSCGGLSFQTHSAVEPGSLLWLCIRCVRPVFEARGRVSWCRWRRDHYEVGVEFMAPEDRYRARMVEQLCYIERYRRDVLRREGRRLTPEQAAHEWIDKYARDFPPIPATLPGHPA